MNAEHRERLAAAITDRRRFTKDRNRERRAADGIKSLKRAMVQLAPFGPDVLDQIRLPLAEVQQRRSPWTDDDRWAVVRADIALHDEGVVRHVIARELIRLHACRGTGKPAEVQACLVVMRKERHRYRHRRTP